MKSLLRPAAVVSSLTIFAAYVYLQGSGRSLTELWSPATAEAGAPFPMSVSPDNGPTFVYREPGMPATKSMPLPIDVRPSSSGASGGYSSGIVPGAASAPPWLPTPASNPVPAKFPDPSAMRMLAGSKSLSLPVQVAPQAAIAITPALPTGAGPAGTVTPTDDQRPIFSQSGGSYGWMNRPGASPVLSSNGPPPPVQPYKAYPFRFMAATKAAVMPVQISPSLPVVVAPQPTNEYRATAPQSAAPQTANSPPAIPRSYAPGQSLNTPRVAPQYPLFQGVPAAVPASSVQQR